MCNCARCKGAVSSNGSKGDTGATGPQGLYGGFSGDWLWSTSTSTGPTSTFLRLNNATAASVTKIYVSDTGVGSVDYDAFLDSLLNGSNYGYVRIFKKDDSTKFWMGQITAVTDNGTDHELVVTFITSSAAAMSDIFDSGNGIVLSFAPAGSQGTTITSDFVSTATTQTFTGAAAYATVTNCSFALAAGTYIFDFWATIDYTESRTLNFRLHEDSTAVDLEYTYITAAGTSGNSMQIYIGAKVVLASAATVTMKGKVDTSSGLTLAMPGLKYIKVA